MADRTCVLVGTIKDEGPYLLEWLAYHKVIGFSQAFVFHNDCTDYSDQMLRLLHRFTPFVRQFDNSKQKDGLRTDPQRRAYQRAMLTKDVTQADYAMVIDADEFLQVKCGAGRLDDLFHALGDFDVCSMTWRLFGNSGIQDIEDELVIEQFQKARADETPTRVRMWGAKSLFRLRDVVKLGVHRPYHTKEIRKGSGTVKWVNGSGKDVFDRFRDGNWRVHPKSHGAKFAEINHYAVRSADAFLVKQHRGSANAGTRERLDLDYFQMFNCNDVFEDRITRHVPAVLAQIQDWKNTVPGLAQAHAKALAAHRAVAADKRAQMQAADPDALAQFDLAAT